MPFGICLQQSSRLIDRHMLADASDDVLQHASFRRVIEHIVDGDQRDETLARNRCKSLETTDIVAAIEQLAASQTRWGAARCRRIRMLSS